MFTAVQMPKSEPMQYHVLRGRLKPLKLMAIIDLMYMVMITNIPRLG